MALPATTDEAKVAARAEHLPWREAFPGAVFVGFTVGYWERKPWTFEGMGGPVEQAALPGRFK